MSGKIAVVTGAGSGIGRASSLALLKNGYKVALAGRRKDALDETAKLAGNNAPNALAVPTDVTKRDDIVALFAKVKATWGRLDLVFNNAGGGAPPVPLEELPYETWLAGRGGQPDRPVPVHPGSDEDHEGPEAQGRPHHQQRLDLGACAAAVLGRLHLDQARHHRPHQVDLARRPAVRHRLRPDRHRQRRDADDRAHDQGRAAARRLARASSRAWTSRRSPTPSSTWTACRSTPTCSS